MPRNPFKRKPKKTLRIGFDLDGVILYNPARIARRPIKSFKRRFIPSRTDTFYVPKTKLEQFVWQIVHKSSVWIADGYDLVKDLAKRPDVEIYLITARFAHLKPDFEKWLKKIGAEDVFVKWIINEKDEQPHKYKLKQIEKYNLDYFVEDNWDIVSHLAKNTKVKAYWIYNILDRQVDYSLKFPTLKKAVTHILQDIKNVTMKDTASKKSRAKKSS